MLNAMKVGNGKAPGPDGLNSEFYKEFNYVLLDLMFEMFKDSLSGKGLPQTLQYTNISVILKKGNTSRILLIIHTECCLTECRSQSTGQNIGCSFRKRTTINY